MENTKIKETTKSQRKRKRNSDIPCLSEDVVFNILTWVPAASLHNVIRLVCKSWGRIIASRHLVTTHLSRSEFTFNLYASHSAYFKSCRFDHRRGIFQDRSLKKLKYFGVIKDCCLGLILFYEDSHLHLINPITKQKLRLPKCPKNSNPPSFAKIAHIARTGEIKIVCVDEKTSEGTDWNILTIGNDMSWKMLNHNLIMPSQLFSIGSFIICELYHNNTFWTVDLDDESIHLIHCPIHLPKSISEENFRVLIPMERDLYVLYHLVSDELVIWKLKDFRRRGEWVEVLRTKNVDAKLWKCAPGIKYNAWLENRKILIYSKMNLGPPTFMAYDFIRRSNYGLLLTDYTMNGCNIHTSSLVSF